MNEFKPVGYEEVHHVDVNGLGHSYLVIMKDGKRYRSDNSHETVSQAVAKCRERFQKKEWEGRK
jgi:hypothetical protein